MPLGDDLRLMLQQYGLHYSGDDLDLLRRLVEGESSRREGAPSCFARSFSAGDNLCQRCDLWERCQRATVTIRWDFAQGHDFGSCDRCDGDLMVPLYNHAGVIVDYGCSTPGCRTTEDEQERRLAARGGA